MRRIEFWFAAIPLQSASVELARSQHTRCSRFAASVPGSGDVRCKGSWFFISSELVIWGSRCRPSWTLRARQGRSQASRRTERNSNACRNWLSRAQPNLERARVSIAHVIRDVNDLARMLE